MKFFRFVTALALMTAAGVAVIILFAKPSSLPRTGGLKVVAAENFWGDIASQIGGGRASVVSIVTDPSADPHMYESNARNAAAVASADIVIMNGLGYDDFMTKLLAAAPSDSRRVVSAAEASKTAEGANPHIWYDPSKARLAAAEIAKAYAEKDPAHATEYQTNLMKFETSLQPLDEAASRIASFHSGKAVAYTERVPEYMLRRAGLSIASPEGFARSVESGSDPSPVDTALMRGIITRHEISALLYNSQAGSAVTAQIQELARKSGVPVVAVTETMPAAQPSYQAWQLSQIKTLEEALNGN